jgi:acetyl esterase/lipase
MKVKLLIIALLVLPVLADAQTPVEIPLWTNGAPGFENRRNEPTLAKDWWIKNIHNPSITVYLPPKEKANGTAVLICPGGGHRELVFNAEGRDPAGYLSSLGVTAIVLKYRLAREENSPYTIDKHVREDVYRAMRIVRSKASDWSIDPHRVGIMGFSAGGEVVALVAYANGDGSPTASDPVDKLNAKPDFQILIYPGPLGIPEQLEKDAPPAFILAANDDACCSGPSITLLQRYHQAKIPVEAHIYAQGAHGFNMGDRSKLNTIKTWPQRMADWLADSHYLGKTPSETKK